MSETIKYGIFGLSEVTKDDAGFITMHAVISESGLYVGIPPEEVRIVELHPLDAFTDEELDTALAEDNKKRDLPLYRRKVLVKVLRST